MPKEAVPPFDRTFFSSATVSFLPGEEPVGERLADHRLREVAADADVRGDHRAVDEEESRRALPGRGERPGDRGAVLLPLAGLRLPAEDQDDLPLHVDAGVVVAPLGRGVEAVPDEDDLGGDVPGASVHHRRPVLQDLRLGGLSVLLALGGKEREGGALALRPGRA